jgi:hypothetical protein
VQRSVFIESVDLFHYFWLTACHSADGLSGATLALQRTCGEVRTADVAC